MNDDGPLKFDQHSVLELFNLENEDVEEASYQNINGDAAIHVTLIPRYDPCPVCGCKSVKIKEYKIKRITHSVLTDRKCILLYNARRYQCSFCRKTFTEHNPFTFGSSSISSHTVISVLKDLKN